MAVFNSEEYVLESVNSILNQTYPNFEFIIVDDCSTDKTKDLLNEIKDPRVKIFTLDMNRGQTYSLNYGIERSTGDWIFRQDADDLSLPERIEKQLRFIQQHPDSVAVASQITSISAIKKVSDNELRAIQWSNELLTREEINHFRFIAPPIVHGTAAFSKMAFIKAGKYNENYMIGQDFDLWIRLLEIGPIDKVPEVLYCYRVDPDSISRKDESKTCFESLTISSFHIKNFQEKRLNRVPFFIVSGPKAGCQFFEKEIASKNQISVLAYLPEEVSSNKIKNEFFRKKADGIILLDGKYSEKHLTELKQFGFELNSNLFRLWNVFIKNKEQVPTEANIEISVIVPCYNDSSSILDTIISLDRQTFPKSKYEIIVVDDASTDDSYEILNQLEIENLKIIKHIMNKGASGARNTGVSQAKGEIMIFCDSDFLVPPCFIENHVNHHKENEMLAVSGMGHWKFVITHDFTDQWSTFEKKYVSEFYTQPFIQKRLLESQNNHLIHEKDISTWNLEPFSFCPDYLTEWVDVVEEVFETFGPHLEQYYLPWLTFCTGNISLKKRDFLKLEGFDESLRRLEDWEFGYRFYKNGGKFMLAKDCEAYHQLSPISPQRNQLQKNAYQMFCKKHPDFDVHLLSLLFFKNVSFKQLSKVLEQHDQLKSNHTLHQKILDHFELTLKQFSNGEKLSKITSSEKLYYKSSINKIKLTYLEWANIYRELVN